MAPASAKRRSARKREPTSRKLDTLEAAPSPSPRATKRRKTNTAPAPLVPEPLSEDNMDEDEDDDSSDDAANTNALTEVADRIVPYLTEADYSVIVSLEHPNREHDANDGTISAYAKIAGKTWTYYVKDASIKIGRSPDESKSIDQTRSPPPEDTAPAHIDLGPSKLVSRTHAELYFDPDDERWHIKVNGRNGVRINNAILRRGQQSRLESGDVIDISGTEMIFVSPDVPAKVDQRYIDRVEKATKVKEPEPWSEQTHSHPQPPQMAAQFLPTPHQQQMMAYGAQPFNPGQPILAPAPPNFPRPVTPVRQQLQPSYLPPGSVTSPAFGHVILDSNEETDYSSDAVKDIKPPCSYATLISQAILAADREKSSLHNIYEWIKARFSYYRHIEQGWQNSIRHNLSLNAAFMKVPRESHEPGKGGLWTISADKIEEFRRSGLKMTTRGGARRTSGPNSPAPKRSPKKTSPKTEGGLSTQVFKTSPTASTPPISAYPPVGVQPMQTPSRVLRGAVHLNDQPLPQLSDDASPLPNRASFLSTNANAGSPPTLSSSAYLDDQHQGYNNIYTPAPQRREPKLTVPSTAKLPSQYLPQSSPAPFWRSVNNGSTPARFPESSPVKGGDAAATMQSSSPPTAINGSPIRARGSAADLRVNGMHGMTGLGIRHQQAEEDDDDDDIDLMGRQFPQIGDGRVPSAAH